MPSILVTLDQPSRWGFGLAVDVMVVTGDAAARVDGVGGETHF